MAKAKGAVSQGLPQSSPTTAKERWRQVQAVFALQHSGIPAGSQWKPVLAVFFFPTSQLLCGMLNIGLSSYLELALTPRAWAKITWHFRLVLVLVLVVVVLVLGFAQLKSDRQLTFNAESRGRGRVMASKRSVTIKGQDCELIPGRPLSL